MPIGRGGFAGLLVALFSVCSAGRAAAGVLSYTVNTDEGKTVLTSVTVQRGEGTAVFDASKLMAARLAHFKAATPRVAAPGPLQPDETRDAAPASRASRQRSGRARPL